MRLARTLASVLPLAATACLLLTGCSEKGGLYRWDPVHPIRKVAVPGMVALSSEEVFTVGYGYPAEGALRIKMVSMHHTAAGWTELPVPGHETESTRLNAAALATDGSIWACGAATGLDGDFGTAVPLMYRYSTGVWSEVSIAEAGDILGTVLTAIGAGPGGEIRAVGPAAVGKAVCYRLLDGHWSRMPLPEPIGAGELDWTLYCIYRAPDGTWYAGGGGQSGPLGGVLFKDTGSGWTAVAGPDAAGLTVTAISHDAAGELWVAGNVPAGDSTQGALFHRTGASYARIPITMVAPGSYQIFAMAFGPTGHGWVAGGRAPDEPFFAGTLGGTEWQEVVEKDRPLPGVGIEVEEGGEIFAIQLLSETLGWASGQAEEFEIEGGQEFVPRVFRLAPAEEESERGSPRRITGPGVSAVRFR